MYLPIVTSIQAVIIALNLYIYDIPLYTSQQSFSIGRMTWVTSLRNVSIWTQFSIFWAFWSFGSEDLTTWYILMHFPINARNWKIKIFVRPRKSNWIYTLKTKWKEKLQCYCHCLKFNENHSNWLIKVRPKDARLTEIGLATINITKINLVFSY